MHAHGFGIQLNPNHENTDVWSAHRGGDSDNLPAPTPASATFFAAHEGGENNH